METTNNKLANDSLVSHANDLLEIAKQNEVTEPYLPIAESAKIEVVFFQRYFRTKKISEFTGSFAIVPRMERKTFPVLSSFVEHENGTIEHDGKLGYFSKYEERELPLLKDGKITVKKVSDKKTVIIENFPLGKMFKVNVIIPEGKEKTLNQIIGRATVQFRKMIKDTNLKGINKSQTLFCCVPIGEGVTISNYMLYGASNKHEGLKAKNLFEDGEESSFAKGTLTQFEDIVSQLKGKELSISAEWNNTVIQWPALKELKAMKVKK